MNPADVSKWLQVIGALVAAGKTTIADIRDALVSLQGMTDAQTAPADDANLDALRDYVAQKYGEAIALQHFGE